MVQIKRYGVTQGNCEPHPQGEYVRVDEVLKALKLICEEDAQENMLTQFISRLDK